MKQPVIKIYISCHKPAILPSGPYYYPIQVGAALTTNRFPDMLYDDTGDNISDRNKRYCELTAQYWAWKNDKADYVGFCHYRRYFSFASVRTNLAGDELVESILNEDLATEFCLHNPKEIRRRVTAADVLLTEPKRFEAVGVKDLYTQFGEFSQDLRLADLQTAVAVLKRLHPEFSEAADAYLGGSTLYPCNMFIMKRPIFERYCAWLFPILEETERVMDYSGYTVYAMRTIGHIAERLLGVFCTYLMQNEPECRFDYLQRLYLQKTDPEELLTYDLGVKSACKIFLKKQLHMISPSRFPKPIAPDIGVMGALKAHLQKGAADNG